MDSDGMMPSNHKIISIHEESESESENVYSVYLQ